MEALKAIVPRFTGRIWPTGKFGVSRVRETPNLSLCESHRETAETQFNSLGIKAHGVEAVLKFRGAWERVVLPDLSNVPISTKTAKRGSRGITRWGKNLISSAAVVMEEKFDKSLLTFATVTLPHASLAAMKAIAMNWPKIVKEFVRRLRRGLQSKGLPSIVFGVSEIQPKRLQTFGYPALHLHLVFVGRNSRRSSWQVDRKNVRNWWKKTIAPFYPPATDFSAVENVQRIKKSTASYLGKYMSKGADAIAELAEKGFSDWIPSAWYTISDALRVEVLARVIRGEECGNFLNWLCHNVMANWVRWVAPVCIKRSDGTEYAIGFAGSLSVEGMKQVRCIFEFHV